MQTIPIPLVGAESVSSSIAFNAQKTTDYIPVVDPESSYGSALFGRPGNTLKTTIAGIGYGLTYWKGHIYGVWGTSVYKIDSNLNETKIGNIGGVGYCTFARSSLELSIARPGACAVWDGTNLNPVYGVNTVTFINQKFVASTGGNTYASSNLLDAETYSGLNQADAESNWDDLVLPFAFKETLYLFGDSTIETFYDAGTGSPPFERYTGGLINVGTASYSSVAANDSFIYFVGDDRRIYRLEATNHQQISSRNITNEIESLTDISDATGYTFKYNGQNFYAVVFPSADRTFVYCETNGLWAEWTSSYGRYLGVAYVYAFNKNLVQGKAGNLYEMTGNSDDGDEIIRVRRGIHLHSGLLPGMGGRRVFLSALKLIMQSGNGATSGQGVTPKIMLRISENGGRTYGTGIDISSGVEGDCDYQVEWFGLGASFFDGVLELTCSDPVEWNLFQLFADVEIGIR